VCFVQYLKVHDFDKYYQGCNDYCSIGKGKANKCYSLIVDCPRGDFAELGVYRGGFTMFLGRLANKLGVKAYGFDTFEGMPFKGPHDHHSVGDFVHQHGSFESVSSRVNEHVELVKGVFTDKILGHDRPYSFVHIDADQYQSTIDGLRFFYPKLLPGGVIALDDYDWHACPGVKIALDEFGVEYTPGHFQAFIKKQCIM
jgi:O-methyltransferase